MRALVFNLLQAQARLSNCEQEAWEIVTEFAAAEALLERVCEPNAEEQSDETRRTPGFIAAAEALLGCIGNATRSLDFYEDEEDAQGDEDLGDAEEPGEDDPEFLSRPSAFPEPD